MDQTPPGQPFFMWMNYSDPHLPFTAQEYTPDPTQLTIPEAMPDTEEVRKDLAQHIGEVNRLDAYIGQVLLELDERGLTENTIILFMGDNGADLLRGKGTLYDLGIHVPLVVAGPGVVKGAISDAQISGTDLAPTILEMASTEIPDAMTGQSFAASLRGEA
ncbi:MAG: sulfatase-like hydrolase/transferase [Saprospiraceae bacterium]|nr:sulfatase-like hydrolase/transferase [Saprospiraceae bacterium]